MGDGPRADQGVRRAGRACERRPGLLRRHDISEPKAAIVVAAFEIACRIAKAKVPRSDLLDQPAAVASYLALRYGHSDQEIMGALFLNVRNRLIGECDIFRGTKTGRRSIHGRS